MIYSSSWNTIVDKFPITTTPLNIITSTPSIASMTKNIIYKPRKERKDKLGEYLQSLDNKQKQSKFNIQQINIKSKSEFLHLNQEDTSASQISSEVSENEIYSMKDILTTKSNKSENNTSWKPKEVDLQD